MLKLKGNVPKNSFLTIPLTGVLVTGVILVVCLYLLTPSVLLAAGTTQSGPEYDYIVQNVEVEDIDNDDGSGLKISWKPLGIDARIIEYRIYRGVNADTLFYIGNIPVNPRTGFSGDRVYYYDTGYSSLVSINSPGKLRQENQQPEGSPIYREVPRDLNVLGPLFSNYSVLGAIPKKEFYYRTTKITEESGEETNYYAGLKFRQFQSLLRRLIADNEYFYAVIAVNEQRRFYPHSKIVSGIPRVNSPEQISINGIIISDIERLQFEWSQPITSDGVGSVNLYLLNKSDSQDFNENHNKELLTPIMSTGYSSKNTAHLDIKDGKIEGTEVSMSVNTINDFYLVVSLQNYWGAETFSKPASFSIFNSEDLPSVPLFTVVDKPNDQGDYLNIYWDEPVVFLTNSSFLNKDRTRLRINYEYETNQNFKIRNIYFKVFDHEGDLITEINEFYQDLYFDIQLPEEYSRFGDDYDISRKISFEMSFRVTGDNLPEDYTLFQDMKFDDDYQAFRPQELKLYGESVNNFTYNIYKKPYTGESFRLVARSAGNMRENDDNIRYETIIYKSVSKYDAETQMIYVDPNINAYYDKEKKSNVNTPIYMSLVQENLKKMRTETADIRAKMPTAENDEELTALESRLNSLQGTIATYENDFFQEANSKRSDRARMKFISNRRERELRTFQYKIIKSDGKARYVETDVYRDLDGNPYMYPVPNWFNTNRIATLIASLLFGLLVLIMIKRAKMGHDLYIRPIAGIEEIDNAIGRATEMGKPILFNPGLSSISDVATLAGLSILGRVAKKAAEYDTRILVPLRDYIVMPIAQEIVKEAHYEAGRPDTYDKTSVFFITTDQFAFVAGVNGVMIREKCATCFYMGMYWAEALIMTETGNTIGAVQIAGTDAVTQIPFFITTCDYTLIGEELYGASAYLAREPLMMGTLKAVDAFKFLILVSVIVGTLFSTAQLTFFINMFPDK